MLKIQGTAQTMPTYVTCGPNEAIIVSGCCRSSPTIRAGGRVFVWPAFHKVQRYVYIYIPQSTTPTKLSTQYLQAQN